MTSWEVWIKETKENLSGCPYQASVTVNQNNPILAKTAQEAAEEYWRRVTEEHTGAWVDDFPIEIEVRPIVEPPPPSGIFRFKEISHWDVVKVK